MSGWTCTHRCSDCGSTTAPGLDAIAASITALQAALQPPPAPAPTGLTVWLVATHDVARPTQLVVAADAAEAVALCNDAYGQGTVEPDDVRALSLRQARLLPDAWEGDAL